MRLWSEAGTEGRGGGDSILLKSMGSCEDGFYVLRAVLISVSRGLGFACRKHKGN